MLYVLRIIKEIRKNEKHWSKNPELRKLLYDILQVLEEHTKPFNDYLVEENLMDLKLFMQEFYLKGKTESQLLSIEKCIWRSSIDTYRVTFIRKCKEYDELVRKRTTD